MKALNREESYRTCKTIFNHFDCIYKFYTVFQSPDSDKDARSEEDVGKVIHVCSIMNLLWNSYYITFLSKQKFVRLCERSRSQSGEYFKN